MNSIEFAVQATRVIGRRAEAELLAMLAYSAGSWAGDLRTSALGNALGLTRQQASSVLESLVARKLVTRRSGSKNRGLHLTVRTRIPLALAKLVAETCLGLEKAAVPLPEEALDRLVTSGDQETRTSVALCGLVVAQWSQHRVPTSLAQLARPDEASAAAAVMIDDYDNLVDDQIVFVGDVGVTCVLHLDRCRQEEVFRVPDVSRSIRAVTSARRSAGRDYSQPNDSNAFMYARADKLPEDTQYFSVITDIVATWNEKMLIKATLHWPTYKSLRELLHEEGLDPERIKSAFSMARNDQFWRDKPLHVLIRKAETIETILQTGTRHDRYARNQEIVKTGEDFDGYEF